MFISEYKVWDDLREDTRPSTAWGKRTTKNTCMQNHLFYTV